MSTFGWGLVIIVAVAAAFFAWLIWLENRNERERQPKHVVKGIARVGKALEENEQPDSAPRQRPLAISSQFPGTPARRSGPALPELL